MSEREPPEPSDGDRSSEPEEEAPKSHLDDLDLDEVDVRDLLRAALEPPDDDEEKVQRNVQKQIREVSRGRFYADGWSTAKAPKETFLVTSVLMLVIVLLAWIFLGPTGFEILSAP